MAEDIQKLEREEANLEHRLNSEKNPKKLEKLKKRIEQDKRREQELLQKTNKPIVAKPKSNLWTILITIVLIIIFFAILSFKTKGLF